MADWKKVESQIEKLIADANVVINSNKTNITDVIEDLISGYGQGECEDLSDIITLLGDGEVVEGSGSGGQGGSGSASLNIHYGDTEPSDTSMLWCKCDEPSKVLINSIIEGVETLEHTVSNIPTTLKHMGIGVVNDDVFLFGGYVGTAITDSIYKFNTKTNEFTTLTTKLPVTLAGMGVGVVDDKIYLFGGKSSTYVTTIYMFDTISETITTLDTVLPSKNADMCVEVVGKNIYILGGSTSSTNGIKNVCVFNTETQNIRQCTSTMKKDLYYMCSGVVGENIYLFGGRDYNGTRYKYVQIFDTRTETFTSTTELLPSTLMYAKAGTFGNKIYIFGGLLATGESDKIYVYDTVLNTVTELESTLLTTCIYMGIGVVGTNMYLFGGDVNQKTTQYLNRVDRFSIGFGLEHNKVKIQSSSTKNIFNILNSDVVMEMGVDSVYIGNSDGQGEKVEAYLYQNDTWTQI